MSSGPWKSTAARARHGQRMQQVRKAQRVTRRPLHPHEETVLRQRAYDNVKEDLGRFLQLARSRSVNPGLGKRTRFLAETEFKLWSQLLGYLEGGCDA